MEPILDDIVPGAADQQSAAVWAIGIRGVAIDISFVYIAKPGVFGDLPSAMQRFRGCSRFVAKFEVGMEGGEVQRDVGTEIRENPVRELASLGWIVV